VIVGSRSGRLGAAAFLLVAGCGTVACSPGLISSPSPVALVPGSSASGSAEAPSSSDAATSPGVSDDAPAPLITVDPALLDLLPDKVGDLPLVASPDAAADPASDPDLAKSAQSLAVALAVDQTSGDLVVASVVKLKPRVFSDEFFRDWRDSFDEGVCGQAGGVTGNAQATMSGRTVYIGTCEGGVHTYHVHLDKPEVIISLNSVGEGRLGEQLMESLPD
jgi:hypothetical protein